MQHFVVFRILGAKTLIGRVRVFHATVFIVFQARLCTGLTIFFTRVNWVLPQSNYYLKALSDAWARRMWQTPGLNILCK